MLMYVQWPLGTGGKEPSTFLVSYGEVTNRKTTSHMDQRGTGKPCGNTSEDHVAPAGPVQSGTRVVPKLSSLRHRQTVMEIHQSQRCGKESGLDLKP